LKTPQTFGSISFDHSCEHKRRQGKCGLSPGVSDMIDQETLLSALRTVKDPELNVNVIDLGLVYSIQTHEDHVDVEMTLTSPACPAGPEILHGAVKALESVPGIAKANVRLVMSPPWSPDRMSDAARDQLGFF
jgi:metal-sulfur cluster biosynthetic enzyme